VVDFGAQYAQLIARRIREARVYSEIVPHTTPVADLLARNPAAVVLFRWTVLGVRQRRARGRPRAVLRRCPRLGICYGFQAMAAALGGTVARTGCRSSRHRSER